MIAIGRIKDVLLYLPMAELQAKDQFETMVFLTSFANHFKDITFSFLSGNHRFWGWKICSPTKATGQILLTSFVWQYLVVKYSKKVKKGLCN